MTEILTPIGWIWLLFQYNQVNFVKAVWDKLVTTALPLIFNPVADQMDDL